MKKKRTKQWVLIITLIIVWVILLFPMMNASSVASSKKIARSFDKVVYDNQLQPQLIDGNWTFDTDEDFKIMQLTDIHIGGGLQSLTEDKYALNAVGTMISVEKPDLVIITGDMIFPVPTFSGSFDNKRASTILIELMENLGVYWTVAFGNHDSEAYNFYSRKKIAELYANEKYEYCLFQIGPDDVDGYGNQIINVRNSLGLITQSLYIFDSHSYVDNDYFGTNWYYDNIHQNQVDWYKQNVAKFNQYNANLNLDADKVSTLPMSIEEYANIKSLAFFHIPLREYRDAYNEWRTANGDTDNVKWIYGEMNEAEPYVFCGKYEDTLFETMLELGSTQGMFVGHDHVNNFSIEYKGIRLTYGLSIDYLAYRNLFREGDQRGCTIINVNNKGEFDCYQENYYQSKYTSHIPKESVTLSN